MRLGVISDIHGNYPALKQVIIELHKLNCDKIICLGDVAGYYSMINECVDLLRKEKIVCIKGNHDSYLLGEGSCPRSNSVNRCIEFQKSIITKENYQWLSTFGSELRTKDYWAVHGGWNDPIDEYIDHFDFEWATKEMPAYGMFLSGHTHVQKVERCKTRVYCNPGSVGQPRDYDCRAAFAIIDDGIVYLKRIKYDIDLIAKHMSESGFNDYFYRNLYHGCKIGDI